MLHMSCLRNMDENLLARWDTLLKRVAEAAKNAPQVLKNLAALPAEALNNPFVKRDVVDIARSLIERMTHWGLLKVMLLRDAFSKGEDTAAQIIAQLDVTKALARLDGEIIGCHADYSMHQTLEGLKKVSPVNPVYESSLKQNLVNGYCRQACYEPWKNLYEAEQEAYFGWVKKNLAADNRGEWAWDLDETAKQLFDAFMAKPLAEMQSPCDGDLLGLIAQAAEIISKITL